jgi:hypothetical protein
MQFLGFMELEQLRRFHMGEYREARRRLKANSNSESVGQESLPDNDVGTEESRTHKKSNKDKDSEIADTDTAIRTQQTEVAATGSAVVGEDDGNKTIDGADTNSTASAASGMIEFPMTEKRKHLAMLRWEARQLLYDTLEPINWRTIPNLAFKHADALDMPDEYVIVRVRACAGVRVCVGCACV